MADPVIIHHAGCPDGFGAAWWLGCALGDHEKHEGRYGQAPPDCTGRDVWLVDFCYPADDLRAIALRAKSVTVLDHHQTSHGYLEGLAGWDYCTTIACFCDLMELGAARCIAVVDETHSGVGLVADYVRRWRGTIAPQFLDSIEDRDLWRFELACTAEVFAAVTSRPYTDEAWDEMASMPYELLVAEGRAIERYRAVLVEHCLSNAARINLLGSTVWATAAPYMVGSDVAGALAKRDPFSFAAYWIIHPDHVQWGLRSTDQGADVAALAEHLGGGGHKHASGFRTSLDVGLRIIGGSAV